MATGRYATSTTRSSSSGGPRPPRERDRPLRTGAHPEQRGTAVRAKRVECPKCKKTMAAGYVLSYTKWEKAQLTHWTPGLPKKSIWTGLKVEEKHLLPVT